MNEFSLKNEDHLVKLTDKYPWCASAQFYLLHQYKKNNSPQFEDHAEKTALFFNNTNWLNWQLHLLSDVDENENKKIDKEELPAKNNAEKILEENKIEQSPVDNLIPIKNINEEPIAFEPLYTVDYFASQGIKITEEPIANDKLGTQLKSFTEWLKSMKKIHKENLPAGDELTDKKIQRIAETSNTDAEVATEAMADVLIKQNKTDKAIEIYEKLSLNNPSKSAYFAAKINTLKTS